MKQIDGQITIFEYIKPIPVDIKGLCDDGYCPVCGVALDDLVPECPYCKTRLNWDRWKIINEVD